MVGHDNHQAIPILVPEACLRVFLQYIGGDEKAECIVRVFWGNWLVLEADYSI